MVIVLFDHDAVTPGGRPVKVPIPVAPVVLCVMFVKAVLIHKLGVADGAVAVLSGLTVIVPIALTIPQPPVKGMV